MCLVAGVTHEGTGSLGVTPSPPCLVLGGTSWICCAGSHQIQEVTQMGHKGPVLPLSGNHRSLFPMWWGLFFGAVFTATHGLEPSGWQATKIQSPLSTRQGSYQSTDQGFLTSVL